MLRSAGKAVSDCRNGTSTGEIKTVRFNGRIECNNGIEFNNGSEFNNGIKFR